MSGLVGYDFQRNEEIKALDFKYKRAMLLLEWAFKRVDRPIYSESDKIIFNDIEKTLKENWNNHKGDHLWIKEATDK